MNFFDVFLIVIPTMILRAAIEDNGRFVLAGLFYLSMLLVGYMTFGEIDE